MSEPSLLIVGGMKRRRGRPKTTEEKSTLSAWIPTVDHDFIVQLAEENSVSVSELVGTIVRHARLATERARRPAGTNFPTKKIRE